MSAPASCSSGAEWTARARLRPAQSKMIAARGGPPSPRIHRTTESLALTDLEWIGSAGRAARQGHRRAGGIVSAGDHLGLVAAAGVDEHEEHARSDRAVDRAERAAGGAPARPTGVVRDVLLDANRGL